MAPAGIERVAAVPGGDACAEIQAAIDALPSEGGIVDARGFTSDQTCSSSVSSGLSNLTILLPPHHITGGSWSFSGNGVVLEGEGGGDNGASTSALVEASPPSRSVFVSFTGGDLQQIENLSILGPCSANGSCTINSVNYIGLPYDGTHASARFTVNGRCWIGQFPRYGLKVTGQDVQLNGLDVFGNGVAGILSEASDVFSGPQSESVNNGMFSYVLRNPRGGSVGANHLIGGDYSGEPPQFQTWQPSHRYALGTYISDCSIKSNACIGYAEEVTKAGTSGNTAPTFSASVGGTTSDGSVIWTNRSAVGDCIVADGSESAIYNLQFVGLNVMPCYETAIYAHNITESVIANNYLSNVGRNLKNIYDGISVTNGTGGNVISGNEINGDGGIPLAYGILDKSAPIYAPDRITGNTIFNSSVQVYAPNSVADIVGFSTPSGSCGNGSTYRNTKGGAGSTLYTCVAGAWVDVK